MDTAYLRKIFLYFLLTVGIIILLADLLYVSFSDYIGLEDGIETVFVSDGSMTEEIKMRGYLSVGETYVFLPDGAKDIGENDTFLDYPCGETAYVSSGNTVAELYGSDVSETLGRLKDIDEKIAFCRTVQSFCGYSLEKIDSLISKAEERIASSDLFGAGELDSLEALIAARSVKKGSDVDYRELEIGYNSKKGSIRSELPDAVLYAVSPANGLFTSFCDGYENLADAEFLASAGLSGLCDIVDGANKKELSGKEIGKIADVNTFRIVCVTDRSSALRLRIGDKVGIGMGKSGSVYTVSVERVVTEENSDRAAVVFYSPTMLGADDFVHFGTFRVILGEKSGFRIPISSLRYEQGVSGVYVLRGSIVKFRRVGIIGGADGYAIGEKEPSDDGSGVPVLKYYDRIIIGGKDLYDGKIIIE